MKRNLMGIDGIHTLTTIRRETPAVYSDEVVDVRTPKAYTFIVNKPIPINEYTVSAANPQVSTIDTSVENKTVSGIIEQKAPSLVKDVADNVNGFIRLTETEIGKMFFKLAENMIVSPTFIVGVGLMFFHLYNFLKASVFNRLGNVQF